MTTLFDSRLSDREFSSHLLHVGDLLGWAKSKRLHLRTTPPIDGSEFVQVEALLCAIERKAGDLTTEQAFEIVANDPALQNERAADDPTTARWLLGAEAHRKWRVLLSGAIAAHELTLLDFGSKLPIDTAPAQTDATPAPEVAKSASGGKGKDAATTNWKMRVQAEAASRFLRLRASGASPTAHSILDDMAKWCRDNDVKTDGGIYPSAGYLRTHVLGGKHWTPPR